MLGSLSAASITFQQSATYNAGGVTVRSDDPSTPGGTVTPPTDTIIAGSTSSGAIVLHGLFEFDLSAIETAAAGNPYTIDSVSLVLRTSGTNGSGGTSLKFDLYQLGANLDFNESTVNWTNSPGQAGGLPGMLLSSLSFVPVTANQTRTFDSTAAFISAISGALSGDPDNTIRLMLKTEVETGGGFARFLSDDDPTESNRPALVINYTVIPEPSSGIALLGGLAILSGLRRRNR